MFDTLQDSLHSAIRTLRGRGKLTESNMRDGLGLVKNALLEADVSFPVVTQFMDRVTEQAIGEQVLKLLDPSQQLVKIVYDELVDLMGPVDHSFHLRSTPPVIMLCGLQGSGKTTTCGKLGNLLLSRNFKPLLVAADLQRPAAIDQLEVIGQNLGIPVYTERDVTDPVPVCQKAVNRARELESDVVILDTAGRLHVDSELMRQLARIDNRVKPDQVYFVVDSMTGQDAVNSAKSFNDALELDGVILTKLDGDARGGAALSVKHVTGVPIKFIGTGEQFDALEEFHPDRMAGRILGMGDIVTLAEQAQQKFDQEEMAQQEARIRKGEFTLDDFRKLLDQATKLGSMSKIMGMIPGMNKMKGMMEGSDTEQETRRISGMIDSMTAEERRNPSKVIDQSRRRRISAGSGVEPHEINELVKQFDSMAAIMKNMMDMGPRDRVKAVQQLTESGALAPGSKMGAKKGSSGKRLSPKERAKLKKKREKEARRRKREKRQGKS